MYNQRNYRPFGQRLPAPTPQAGLPPYRPTGTLNSNQSYLRPPPPPPPPLQNPNWSQNQHPIPRIAPPYPHFYRLPPPPLAPLPTSSYFSPAPFGSFLPPPPSSPPRPPPLPPSSPPTNSNVIQSQTTVKNTSEFNILSDIPPPPPRDEKTVKKIQVLCQYIAKHGDKFEHMTCQKEIGNPEFEFLFGGVPGSQAAISHEYFKWMKKKYISNELPEQEHNLDVSHSPAGSDMDMEDDITHPEEPGKSFVSANHKPDYISNEVDIKPKEGQTLAPDDNQFEKPTTTVGVVDSERSVDSKTEQCNIDLHQQMNQSKESPFRLVPGYASDDGSENDNEPHFENVSPVNEPFFENLSPVAVSPEVKNGPTLSQPVVEASLNITFNIPEPSTNTKILDNKNDGATSIGNDTDCRKNGGARKENSNAKLQVDEFGRMVKKGGDESDSDDYNRRRSKRGRRSRSRSRSPYERRRRSPRRRRENRSRSRSWSPKKRPRSRSPYNRRNRSQLQEICHDFRLGRCFRETCRYSHDPEKIDESWRCRNKQQYLEPVSDRFQNSDKLVPEKYEADKHVNRNDGVDKEFVESPAHTSDVASQQPATVTAISGGEPQPQLAGEYNVPLPPSSSWNSLPPPPSRPQLGGPIPHFQQNQPSFQNNYSFQPFVTPYGPQMTSHLGVYPVNYPIIQQPVGPTSLGQDNIAQIASSLNLVSSNFRPVRPTSFSQDNFAQISSSPNLVSSNAREPPSGITQSFMQNLVADNTAEFPRSRISSHYNPYASTFDKPLSNTFGPSPDQKDTSGGDQYDPLFDSIDPSSLKKSDNGTKEVAVAVTASEENDEFGETADAEVGAVENDSHSPSSPIDLRDVGTTEIEIDQVKPKKSKDSRSMKLFKVSVADFVKEVLKPSWRQGNMSKEAFKTIVKKTVDKVSGAMKKHQVPKSQAKINHYIDSSQRKLTKLVMGYVDKYVKV